MKKGIVCLVICFTAILSFVLGTQSRVFTVQEMQAEVVLDQFETKFDQPMLIMNQRTYVPLRELAEKLGCEVFWNPDGRITIMSESAALRRGVLKSGQMYEFAGYDTKYSFQEEVIEKGYAAGYETKPKTQKEILTPGAALKQLQALHGEHIWSQDTVAVVEYDAKLHYWVIDGRYEGTGTVLMEPVYYVVRQETGIVETYRPY